VGERVADRVESQQNRASRRRGPDPETVLSAAVAALGGDDRPGQHRLAAAVADAIAGGHHLVAEAPTGSGKGLAYLAPAVASGRKVVVSTATLTLQDQLWNKDLPHLRAHGGVPFDAALLKGRSQYVCRAKLRSAVAGRPLLDERPGPTLARDLERLERFAAESTTGDLGDVDVADDSRRAASCAPRECPGAAKCQDGEACFAEHARARAAAADVLVVNHALYCAHLASGGNVLPDHDAVVFDEAHALPDVATGAFGIDLHPTGIRQLATRLGTVGVSWRDTDPLTAAATALEHALDAREGRVDPTDDPLAIAIGGAAERLAAAQRGIDAGDDPTAANQVQQLAASRLDALRRLQTPRDDEVAWVERGTLHLAPISVAASLAERLLDARPAILVSATLGGGTRYAAFARRLGLDPAAALGPVARPDTGAAAGADGGDSDEDGEHADAGAEAGATRTTPGTGYVDVTVESPFDYREQAMLYVARHLPEPRDPGWADAAIGETAALVRAAGGRALILCTSRAAVDRMRDALRADGDHPILVQGEGSRAALLEQFGTDERSVLVATRSFWMGVDVPGPSCVLVVIDRLPFARPDDPLAQARREAAERAGGNGFRDVDLPAAALVLAQGTGRLVRSRSDRGVVAVLDRRLATAGYRDILLDALPPMRRVVDPEIVRTFLGEVTGPGGDRSAPARTDDAAPDDAEGDAAGDAASAV
jgi:ATP-dependent DNA helicase DinG